MLPNGGLSTGKIRWHSKDISPVLQAYYTLKSIEVPFNSELKKTFLEINPTAKMYDWRSAPAEFAKATGITDKYHFPPPEMHAALVKVLTDFIRPSPDDDFVVAHNPLYSGCAILKLLLEYNACGISLANYHKSIFTAAHLYNALRQLHLLDQPWPVMDKIIQIHQKAIIANAISTKTTDMYDRLKYRINL